jgi:hypothetical protein
MYAIKIRKSDMPLLTILNGGIAPEVPARETHFLVVNPDATGDDPTTQIITEKAFDRDYAGKISTAGPELLKLNKRATR